MKQLATEELEQVAWCTCFFIMTAEDPCLGVLDDVKSSS